MKKKATEYFTASAAILLVAAAVAKWFVVANCELLFLLDGSDPFLLLSHRYVLILIGGLELFISGVILLGRNQITKLTLIAWLACLSLTYEAGSAWQGFPNYCNALGNLTTAFPVAPRVLSGLALAFHVGLLIGSGTCLVLVWLQGSRPDSKVRACSTPTGQPPSSTSAPAGFFHWRGGRFQNLVWGWGAGLALFGLLWGAFQFRARSSLPRHMQAILEEVYFKGEIRDAPVENCAGTALLYARDVRTGVGLFLVDLETLHEKQIEVVTCADRANGRAFKLCGWSPDDRYLAFSKARDDSQNRQIVICDGGSGQFIRSFDLPDSVEQGTWLSANTLVILSHSHQLSLYNLAADTRLGPFGEEGLMGLRTIDGRSSSYHIAPLSELSVAYIENDNVWSLHIPTGEARQITQVTDSTLTWLDRDPVSGDFLFCLDSHQSKAGPLLYQYQSRTAALSRLTGTYTLKGQWLEQGKGLAYVTVRGNKGFLAIQTQDPALRTNLFYWGHVRSYSVAPKRDKIYAVASAGDEPLSLWEYDIAQQKLRNLSPPEQHPAYFSSVIAPVEASVTNDTGQRIDYYLLPPGRLNPHKRYPALMEYYADSRYQQDAQFLANAGMFYVAVNRFGIAASELRMDPDDTLTVYRQLLKNVNIDPRRIYIRGQSAGSSAVRQLAASDPTLWRGLILTSPVAFPEIPPGTKVFPSIFISIGDEDSILRQEQGERLLREACRNLIPARIVYAQGGHWISSTDQLQERHRAIAKFILADY